MNFLSKIFFSKYIKFSIIGGINALIYFLLLIFFILITDNYYLSVGISQCAIAIIAYINFSYFQFNSKLELKIFKKFIISNIFLLIISSALVWATREIQMGSFVFGIINIILIAPISYIFNSRFVFNNTKLKKIMV